MESTERDLRTIRNILVSVAVHVVGVALVVMIVVGLSIRADRQGPDPCADPPESGRQAYTRCG